MGLCYDTTSWADRLWSAHLEQSSTGKQAVNEGKKKQSTFDQFAQDIHSRLYLRNDPQSVEDAPDWATKLHETAQDMSEWHQLRKRCQADGFSAGIATESLLSVLSGLLPKEDPKQDQGQQGQSGANGDGGKGDPGQGQPGDEPSPDGSSAGMSPQEKANLRRQIRKAITSARKQVDEAKEKMDGMQDIMGMPGTDPAQQPTLKDLTKIRKAYDIVRNNGKLKQITELAGRMLRAADTKKRTKVKDSVGAIKGITLSGDIPRVLPMELAALRSNNKLEQLLALQKIEQRQALSYQMQGDSSTKRGPIITLVDESASMRNQGREEWSKAVALALLNRATKQNRSWFMAGFNHGIRHETMLEAGNKNNIDAITDALCRGCAGGTDFDGPIERAMEVLKSEKSMSKADVIIITDGEDEELDDGIAERARQLTKQHGVNWYVIGIGSSKEMLKNSLGKIATEMVVIGSRIMAAGDAADAINVGD